MLTAAMKMLTLHKLNDEATSMLVGYLNKGLIPDPQDRETLIKACLRSCVLRINETGQFYKE